MDKLREISSRVLQAEQAIRTEHPNYGTELCLLVEDLKEILGLNEFRGFQVCYKDGCKCLEEVSR
jgi:hypothetical protein